MKIMRSFLYFAHTGVTCHLTATALLFLSLTCTAAASEIGTIWQNRNVSLLLNEVTKLLAQSLYCIFYEYNYTKFGFYQ